MQGSANNTGAVIHDLQSHARRAAFQIGKRQAIIFDLQHDVVRAIGQADRDFLRFPMFDGIGDGFLRDLVKLIDRAGLHLRNRTLGFKAARDFEQIFDVRGQIVQGSRQVVLFDIDGGQIMSEVTGMVHGLLDQQMDF